MNGLKFVGALALVLGVSVQAHAVPLQGFGIVESVNVNSVGPTTANGYDRFVIEVVLQNGTTFDTFDGGFVATSGAFAQGGSAAGNQAFPLSSGFSGIAEEDTAFLVDADTKLAIQDDSDDLFAVAARTNPNVFSGTFDFAQLVFSIAGDFTLADPDSPNSPAATILFFSVGNIVGGIEVGSGNGTNDVPEPASLAIVGLAGALLLVRRRAAKAAA